MENKNTLTLNDFIRLLIISPVLIYVIFISIVETLFNLRKLFLYGIGILILYTSVLGIITLFISGVYTLFM